METVVLIGIPGSGKSSFYKARFFSTHVRVSLDLLKTRAREDRFLESCLQTRQPFVIDNTNPTRQKRQKYILAAKEAGFSVFGFYFQSQIEACLKRNAERKIPEQVPEVAIFSIAKQLELPSYEEGFDQLFYVSLAEREFQVEEWNDEL